MPCSNLCLIFLRNVFLALFADINNILTLLQRKTYQHPITPLILNKQLPNCQLHRKAYRILAKSITYVPPRTWYKLLW